MDIEKFLFTLAQCAPGLLLALVCHEYAHGRVAKMFGDDLAEREGRLTLNPMSHIDPMGTVMFPLLLVFIGVASGSAITPFGWAKPVPVDSRNFKDVRKAVFWVSFAGPLANFAIGILSVLIWAISMKHLPDYSGKLQFEQMLQFSFLINFILMGFNLIPLPPLDGSRMVATYLKGNALRKYEEFARYTPMIFIGSIFLSYATGISIFSFLLKPFIYMAQIIGGVIYTIV